MKDKNLSLTLHSSSYLFYLISGRTLIFIFRGTGSSVVCLVRCLALLLVVSLALLSVDRLTALLVVGGTFLTEGSFQFLLKQHGGRFGSLILSGPV